ncbi:MAG: hypothetical protein ACREEW_15065 [Caulobacteraceae bacterium]
MPASGSFPLAQTLAICSRELTALAGACERLQHRLSPRLARIDDAEEMQRLDLITQQAEAIATYLATLAASLPPHWSADAGAAAEALVLDDLARRLLAVEPLAPTTSGDLELFEGAP